MFIEINTFKSAQLGHFFFATTRIKGNDNNFYGIHNNIFIR